MFNLLILISALKTNHILDSDLGQIPVPLLSDSSFPWSPHLTCHQALPILLLKYIFNRVTSLLTATVSIHTPSSLTSTTKITSWLASLFPVLLLTVHSPHYNKIIFLFKVNQTISFPYWNSSHFPTVLRLKPKSLTMASRPGIIWPLPWHYLIPLSPSLTIFQPHWPLDSF